ncbi:MAG: ABC transporter permease subunit [Pseudomonadota bacterium]
MNRALVSGSFVLLGFGGFTLVALVALISAADGGPLGLPIDRLASPYALRILGFTLSQAFLSVGLSILGAIPLALIVIRYRRFMGRDWIIRLLALPLALPPLVAVIGLLQVWGRSGTVSDLLQFLGLDMRLSIFGMGGVVLAHVFFNLPLAARLMITHLERQPDTVFRLADQLGLSGWSRVRLLEAPLLLPHLPAVAGLVLMLCIGSFTIVLTLGGGPASATYEVAIYQALRFDFDPGLAAVFTLAQLVLATTILLVLHRFGGAPDDRAGTSSRPQMGGENLPRSVLALLGVYGLLLLAPLVALAAAGVGAEWERLVLLPRLWSATITSLVIAACSACLSVTGAYLLAVGRDRGLAPRGVARGLYMAGYASVGSAVLAIPPIILGAGWFILLRGAAHQTALAAVMVIIVNALMALPFVLRVLAPAHQAAMRRYGSLCAGLGLVGWRRFVLIDAPVLARPFAAACAFALVLSVGDLGAAAIFGAYDLVTLPILILNLMGSYRTTDAAGVALALALFVFALIWLADRINRISL